MLTALAILLATALSLLLPALKLSTFDHARRLMEASDMLARRLGDSSRKEGLAHERH